MTDQDSSTEGNSSTAGEGTEPPGECRFNPTANRLEWWVPGLGFTGQSCTSTEEGDSASGYE